MFLNTYHGEKFFSINDVVKSHREKTVLKTSQLEFSTHLRNEFDFWIVRGIMNTSGLLQS